MPMAVEYKPMLRVDEHGQLHWIEDDMCDMEQASRFIKLPEVLTNPTDFMPDDDAYTIIDWIDQVNADPDVGENDDDDTAAEWDEMSDYDLEGEEDDEEEDGDEFWVS